MSARGIILMALGALGTTALIGLDGQGTTTTIALMVLGVGLLGVFFAGARDLLRARAETARVNGLADDVQQEARVHLLEGREAQLARKVEALELRRDEVLAEIAAAAKGTGAKGAPRKPKLVMVASND